MTATVSNQESTVLRKATAFPLWRAIDNYNIIIIIIIIIIYRALMRL